MTIENLPTLDEIRQLIKSRPATITLKELAEAADCSSSLLTQFLNGTVQTLSYDKVAAVYSYLVSKTQVEMSFPKQ